MLDGGKDYEGHLSGQGTQVHPDEEACIQTSPKPGEQVSQGEVWAIAFQTEGTARATALRQEWGQRGLETEVIGQISNGKWKAEEARTHRASKPWKEFQGELSVPSRGI